MPLPFGFACIGRIRIKLKNDYKMENLKERIKELVEYVDKTHRYSSSKIYELYNEAYNKNEIQSTCASCLLTRVRLLKKWLQEHPEEEVNDMEEPVTNSEPIEPTEEATVEEQPEPNISLKKGKKKKGI